MNKTKTAEKINIEASPCKSRLTAIDDTLYVIGGKWKLKVIIALREEGNMRFNELQRTITGISARVLSNELKELEMNGFIKRKILTTAPVVIEYELTGYSNTLGDVLQAMVDWGTKHRKKIRSEAKKERLVSLRAVK
jgi:DNA-binding HxlR family transcriptional regulator